MGTVRAAAYKLVSPVYPRLSQMAAQGPLQDSFTSQTWAAGTWGWREQPRAKTGLRQGVFVAASWTMVTMLRGATELEATAKLQRACLFQTPERNLTSVRAPLCLQPRVQTKLPNLVAMYTRTIWLWLLAALRWSVNWRSRSFRSCSRNGAFLFVLGHACKESL